MHAIPNKQITTALVAYLLALSAGAQTPLPAQARPTASSGVLSPYAEYAQRNGVSTCLGRINQVTGFVVGKSAHQGIMQVPPKAKINQALITSSIAVDLGNATSLVSANFAPDAPNNHCSGSYEAVTYWNARCSQVAKANFPAFQATQSLLQRIAVLEGNGGALKIFLMPAGSGCISIKKEVIY